MRNKFVFTLSTVRGTRSVQAHKLLLILLTMVSLLFIAGFVGGWQYSHFLTLQKEKLENNYGEMLQKYSNVISYNTGLSARINSMSQRLVDQTDIVHKINAIENVLSKKKTNDIFAFPSRIAFDIHRANQDALHTIDSEIERRMSFLYVLPSGSPLRKDSYISSGYGRRKHPLYDKVHFHKGIDLPLKIGDEVVATAEGTIVFAGHRTGYGKTILVSHAYGFSTFYAHLQKILVSVGDIVTKGDVMAEGGNTGTSTGPHVHYEIRYLGKAINPYNFYNWNLVNFSSIFTEKTKVNWQTIITAIDRNLQIQEPQLSLKGRN